MFHFSTMQACNHHSSPLFLDQRKLYRLLLDQHSEHRRTLKVLDNRHMLPQTLDLGLSKLHVDS